MKFKTVTWNNYSVLYILATHWCSYGQTLYMVS